MKRLIIVTGLWILGLVLVWTVAWPMSIPWETVSGTRSSGQYGWAYKYDISYEDHIYVGLDLGFRGLDPGPTWDVWEQGIETEWSRDWISFNVDWVSDGWDQLITVVDIARGDMSTWPLNLSGWGNSYLDEFAAHEFGHMLGLWDEYSGGAVGPDGLINTGGLMATLNGPTLDYYYRGFSDWLDGKLNEPEPVVGADIGPVEGPVSHTPEPGTLLLLASGILGMAAWRKR